MKAWPFVLVFALTLCAAPMYAEEKAGKGKAEKQEEKDEKVAVADLPKAVVDAVNTARPGGTITEADRETARDGTLVYEVDVTQNGKKYEVKVDAAGKVLSNKDDDEEEDDDKGGKKAESKKKK